VPLWLLAGRSEDRIPVEARFSAPVHTGPGAHAASYTMGTGSFPGSSVDHPPPSNAEVKEWVELYLYSPSGPSWPVVGLTLPLPALPLLELCPEPPNHSVGYQCKCAGGAMLERTLWLDDDVMQVLVETASLVTCHHGDALGQIPRTVSHCVAFDVPLWQTVRQYLLEH
jgi:hypothetical protein